MVSSAVTCQVFPRHAGALEYAWAAAVDRSIADDEVAKRRHVIDGERRLGNSRVWVADEFEHDGIRQDATVVRTLIDTVPDCGGVL